MMKYFFKTICKKPTIFQQRPEKWKKHSQEDQLTGTIVYGDTSRVFKRPISDKVWEITARDFIWNQVSLRETSGRPPQLVSHFMLASHSGAVEETISSLPGVEKEESRG